MNDSTRPGYLTPVSSPPAYDEALEQVLIRWISSLAGIPDDAIAPRWTEPPPQTAAVEQTRCEFDLAIGHDANPMFVPVSQYSDELRQTETLEVNCTFYGPDTQAIATQFRDGLYVAQNNTELNNLGMTIKTCGALTPSAEFINNQWLRRYTLTVTLRRRVVREYGIQSLLSGTVNFFGE
ncbi:MAG TPA: hypothetical protein VGH05_19680 [Buttiauxella sp.]|jgi:hypothetical protein